MKLVKFKDGTYGVRKWSWLSLSYRYLDLKHGFYWWDRSSSFFRGCKGTEARSRSLMNSISDRGKVVK